MKRTDFQHIVDVVNKEHDCIYECINDGDLSVTDDEAILRQFLLESQAKGFHIQHSLYDWDYKIERIDNIKQKEANK